MVELNLKEINKQLKELKKHKPLDFSAINKLEYEKYKIKQKEKLGKPKSKTQIDNALFKKKVEKADAIFSKYIRLRDTKGKKIKCITYMNHSKNVSELIEYKGCHNCHWISRGYYNYRWEEWNCFAGCGYCNTYDQENHHNQLTAIQVKLHGLEWVEDKLRNKSRKKPTLEELDMIIEKYTKMFNELNEKCVKYAK